MGDRAKALLVLFLVCSCCSEPPPDDTPLLAPVEVTKCRVQVIRIGTFADGYAYNGRRVIFLVKDTQTGTEYIGISGVGISEVGTHTHTSFNGKTSTTTTEEHEQ